MNAPLSDELARAHDGDAEGFAPGRLWSLSDLINFFAHRLSDAITEIGMCIRVCAGNADQMRRFAANNFTDFNEKEHAEAIENL